MQVDLRVWDLWLPVFVLVAAVVPLFATPTFSGGTILLVVYSIVALFFAWLSVRGIVLVVRRGSVFHSLRPVRRLNRTSIRSLRIDRSEKYPDRLDIVAELVDGGDHLISWIVPHWWERDHQATWAAEKRVAFIENASERS